MSRQTLIAEIGEWLIDQTLADPDILELFNQLCARLYAIGVPISRARVSWPTLHPLFQAETILWKHMVGGELEQYAHQEVTSEEWKRSPMQFMLENNIHALRRNITGPNKLLDFPILQDLVEQGFTDYMVIATAFDARDKFHDADRSAGLFVTWATERAEGFSDDDVAALKKLQRRFAAACKMAIQSRIARNIAVTYLGRHAGPQVLDGAIKLGDGNNIQAVVWYCDMRDSTKLADTMPEGDLLALLNDYFECTAGAAIRFGGEVLDFIGDAVLVIFPFEDEAGRGQAIAMSTMALEESQSLAASVNERRRKEGKVAFQFGVGITVGDVMYGNIGVADRLAFTAIGPVVNQVERIETLTKFVDATALVSADIAQQNQDLWVSAGLHKLDGFAIECELFQLAKAVRPKPKLKPDTKQNKVLN